jgi:transcription elongation factor B subunit 1
MLRGALLEKVCEYMAFKTYYERAGASVEIPVNEFMERVPPEVVLELYVGYHLLIRRIC